MINSVETIKKDTKIQNDISQTIEKYNKESFSTRSQIGQNALIQSKIFKQAIEIMVILLMIWIKRLNKKYKISFLENRIGVTDDKVVEEMNRLDLNKISNKE